VLEQIGDEIEDENLDLSKVMGNNNEDDDDNNNSEDFIMSVKHGLNDKGNESALQAQVCMHVCMYIYIYVCVYTFSGCTKIMTVCVLCGEECYFICVAGMC
jgi:hypothetical protein